MWSTAVAIAIVVRMCIEQRQRQALRHRRANPTVA
jgi:hypothetical protein